MLYIFEIHLSLVRMTIFKCGDIIIELKDRYKYLGVWLQEHLDRKTMSKAFAQSANRALGLLIAKFKSCGGMPFKVFTELFNTVVQPILDYACPIWGHLDFSHVNAVYYRAQRFFLGVGKYTSNLAVIGEMGWKTPVACFIKVLNS